MKTYRIPMSKFITAKKWPIDSEAEIRLFVDPKLPRNFTDYYIDMISDECIFIYGEKR